MRRSNAALGWMLTMTLASAGCRRDAHEHPDAVTPAGLPASAVTRWTEKTELFMEFEPPVVGREGKFAAHVTMLPSFKPVTEGTLVLTLEMADGQKLTARAEAPSSPGIFRALIRPARAGKCSLRVSLDGAQLQDFVEAGACEVFADEASARSRAEGAPSGITFTKEQQWRTEFATIAASAHELQPSVQANAEIQPVAGKEARLTAPATGRVTLATPAPVVGMTVKAGQVLASIAPRLSAGGDRSTLESELTSARVELEAARQQQARAERLFAEQAVPERQVEEARARVSITTARLGAAQGRLAQYTAGASGSASAGLNVFQIRAPLSGTLVLATPTSGESVEEGKLLFTVIDLDQVWLTARIFEPDIRRVETSHGAWFTVEGYEEPFVVDQTNGKRITLGRVIDPHSRTVPIIFELKNPEGRLRIGQFAKVFVATGPTTRMLAIPESAVVEEGGKPFAFVQAEGERFERRALVLSTRSRGLVGVKEGLTEGERVVTRGAYELKLAASSGVIPQHGHVH